MERTADAWGELLPQLALLCKHYLLENSDYSLPALVRRIDDASLGETIDPMLRKILLQLLSFSFFDLLSIREKDLWGDAENLLHYSPGTDESTEAFARRLWHLSHPSAIPSDDNIRLLMECIPVAHRTELLLSIGGDDRLTLQKEAGRLNKYFSSTLPRSKALIRRGSCTCSTIIPADYLIAEQFRVARLRSLLSSGVGVSQPDINEDIRAAITNILTPTGHSSNFKVVLFPSGSDAELLPVLMGRIRYKELAGQAAGSSLEVFNCVTAGGEVGSGTPNACEGKHFSNVSPKGVPQVNNEHLVGITAGLIEVKQFPPRASDGSVAFNEQQIFASIRSKLESNPHVVAILHIVCGSKTGLVYPSIAGVSKLQEECGRRLIVVVDACQLRCRLDIISDYTARGFIVLITGSKFFTGPPFSGAVLLPLELVEELETHVAGGASCIPAGIHNYLTSTDVPSDMIHFRSYLQRSGNDWINFPASMRWHCALSVMEKFHRIPALHVTSLVVHWVSKVRAMVQAAGPYLQLVQVNYDQPDVNGCTAYQQEMAGNVNSVISVAVRVQSDNGFRALSFDESKKFFELMTSSGDSVVMLGQPVKLSADLTVVRIALGADMVVDTLYLVKDPILCANKLSDLLAEDAAVIEKMVSIAKQLGTSTPTRAALMSSIAKEFLSPVSLYVTPALVKPVSEAATTVKVISTVVQAMLRKDGHFPEAALLFDLDAIQAAVTAVAALSQKPSLSGSDCLHCFALKACPVSYIAYQFITEGFGIECASIMEVKHALELGCDPSRIMFDSPCKTEAELEFALEKGVHVNANSLREVQKIAAAIARKGAAVKGTIGLRINPMVGSGSIAALSTATAHSKFGVVCTDDDSSYNSILVIFKQYPFLTALMCHVGSQGMPVKSMASGATAIFKLAEWIDKSLGYNRITMLDIGGGLSLNYTDDSVRPTFEEYFDCITSSCPALFQGRKIVTEFGRAWVGKAAAVVAVVEDVIEHSQNGLGPSYTAISHVGADMFVRPVYCPEKFHHRIELLNAEGAVVTAAVGEVSEGSSLDDHANHSSLRASAAVTIAGPLCFSGDNIAVSKALPKPIPGDRVVVLDAGANTISLFSRHCSRLAPPVYGFKVVGSNTFAIVLIKKAETEQVLLDFWK